MFLIIVTHTIPLILLKYEAELAKLNEFIKSF